MFGPLQGAGPSVAGALLAIGTGVSGIIFISINLLAGKGKSVSRWRIIIFFAIFSLIALHGIMQLLAVR